MTDRMQVLTAGDARLTVDPVLGGRMTSLVVAGHELLVTEGYGPIRWGCYPMAPFAGRIRDGRFEFRRREVELPTNLPPHAIHGTVFERAWSVVGPGHLTIDLGPDWPFEGRVDERLDLRPDGLDVTLTLEAEMPMPASLGWHPWFRRHLCGTPERPMPGSPEVVLDFRPGRMLVRGDDGLPTGAWTVPGPHPWDDCFADLAAPPRVTWPDVLAIELTATADYWVVYDEPVEGICVEPQTEPPDFVNVPAGGGPPTIVEPGRPLTATMSWRWAPA
jgi:aldose 1-epimerase